MGLCIHWSGGSDPHVLSLEQPAIAALEGVFKALEDKTGVFIDPYGRSKISPDHARILVSGIEAIDPCAINAGVQAQLSQLVSTLRTAIREDRWVLALGD